MSWFFPRRPSASTSSDPDDVVRNLRWLEAMLQDGTAWLDGVEAQVTVDAQTEITKEEIKEWAYVAEDVLDEWKFEQLRAEVEPPPASYFGRRYARDPAADFLLDRDFRIRVNELKKRREEIGELNRVLRLGTAQGPRRRGRNLEPPPTSSLPWELDVDGRDDDREVLLKFLLEGAIKGDERLSVVAVMGPAGVGKTTLVQHIFNVVKAPQHFSLKEWVSAAGGRPMMEMVKSIAESLTGAPCNYNQLGVVQDLLKQKIEGQKFLLVLDDVRRETVDGGQWEKLSIAFSGCADGSVIILTTQDEWVADRTKTVPTYILESLSGDHCWSVFRKHAFPGSLPTDGRLVEIGRKIAKECEGSPLVAKALGVRLRHERDEAAWEEVFLQRDMWVEVVPELKVSYHRLPAHLKRCFVYCSMFPKGYLFSREELTRLWMAQGFIKEEMGRSWGDVGIKYFDDLSLMSFFQQSELDTGAFVMPNLLRTLAQSISDGEHVTIENNHLLNLARSDLQKVRHLSVTPSDGELSTEPLSFTTHLRSFLVVPTWPLKNIAKISFSDADSLNHLRVLDVRHTDIEALPNTISSLKHLRYLNLSGTKIEHVDASVFQLYNLQTLDLSCTDIKVLPHTIGNLINLLHLRLNVTKITTLPESIGKLSKLQTLHLGITKIRELPETIGSLKWLRFLCLNVSDIQTLPESICELCQLQTLELQGADYEESNNGALSVDRGLEGPFSKQNDQAILGQGVNDMADSSINSFYIDDQDSSSNCAVREENVSENQQPHFNLQKLITRFYHGERVRMENQSFSKLTSVVIKNCMKCMTLPQLGLLPLLKELCIDGMSVEHVGNKFCSSHGMNGFPILEKLSFQNMSKWKEWDGVKEGDFPHLKELIIFNCPKLKGVPCLRSPLTKLKVERCAVDSILITDGGSLEDLELIACDNLVTLAKLSPLSSLSNLTLMYCQNLTSFPSLSQLENLRRFWIEECEQLRTSLSEELKIFVMSSITFAR
ncbi:hypothetical protein Taro_029342 [Colocasia esculenta]|uniref:AAA+ ATPase domain-containing protein n=1 Tax=Colocasia esculenta TaxID=4460 RepID=A0A843W008_COLES|nr:hypothetical protein [Colocasia esculenta]